MPVCIKCKEDKLESEFGKARPKQKKNGLKTYCKDCCAADTKEYYERNKEKTANRKRIYQKENKEELNTQGREYYWKNREERLIKTKEYRDSNLEKITERDRVRLKKYRKDNPERTRASQSARRALKLRSIPKWETDIRLKEVEWRKQHPGMSLDHIVPITPPLSLNLGGKPLCAASRKRFIGPLVPIVYGFHTPANWQPLTLRENISKGNRDWPDSPWS
jgi:hypothetical protein